MGYNQEKDRLIKMFELKKEKSSLMCSIFSYDGGQAKLAFTRSYEKKDGSMGYGNLGRVNIEEMEFLNNNIDEIIKIMKENS